MRQAIWLTVMSFHGFFLSNHLVIATPQHVTAGWSTGTTTVIIDSGAAVSTEQKPAVDLEVKAAGIEVAWLHHAVTYPYFLRAEPSPNQESITLTGFVPNSQIRQKALSIAVRTALEISLDDHITVQPNMVLIAASETNKNQAAIVKEQLEAAVPGVARNIQISVDANGITTVTGRVDELADRRKIIRALQGIPGCTAVRYDLHIGASMSASGVTQTAAKELSSPTTVAQPPNRATAPLARTIWTPMPDKRHATGSQPTKAATPVTAAGNSGPTKPDPAAGKMPSSAVTAVSSNNSKIDQAQFTVSSVSGLTPPSPMLGSPVTSHTGQPNVLADMPSLPLSAAKPSISLASDEAITKSTVALPKPIRIETPLPVIQVEPTTSSPTGNIEQISARPH